MYNYEHGKVFSSGSSRGRPKGSGKFTPFTGFVDSALEQDFHLNAELLFDKLVLHGYDGKISILRDYISKKRNDLHNGVRRAKRPVT